ncbi:MAG TPA: DNA primase [Candidatus Paceibacterota bacterium]
MSDTAELIKERVNIADFIRQYVALSPAGKGLKGLCPFHKEKTPSFIVSPDRGIWHCFGCSLGGDVIAFLMRYENIEFLEALKVLGERAGIDIKGVGAGERQYAVLYDINNAAKDFFKNYLNAETAVSESARKYLEERGLAVETVKEFELGLAPNSSDTLSKYLLKLGYKISDIERAGLVFKTERGTYWDRFRHRLMFPLHNHFGKTIGFTGRLLPGAAETEVGKYVNSPETPIFAKSRLLFGFHKSKGVIREAKTAVLVEGQMDFLMAWQDGVKNVIATSGTALTSEHLKNLKRIADTIILAFDNDEAGQAAGERVIDLAGAADFSVKILNRKIAGNDPAVLALKDPADFVKHSSGILKKMVESAEPAMRYFFDRYLKNHSSRNGAAKEGPAELKRNARVVLAKIKNLASSIEQSFWIKELSTLTGISETHLFEEMRTLSYNAGATSRKDSKPEIADSANPRNFSRRDLISERMVSLAVADSACREKILEYAEFLAEPYRKIFESLAQKSEAALAPELSELANLINLRSSFEVGDPKALSEELKNLGRQIKIEHFKDLRDAVNARIREAEARGDEKSLGEALQDFDRISKEIYNV